MFFLDPTGNQCETSASLSWPSFLGGGGSTATTSPSSVINHPPVTPPTYILSPQYPVWRVHQYNGIHLKPIDQSQLPPQIGKASNAPELFPTIPATEQLDDGNDDEASRVAEIQTNDIDPRRPAKKNVDFPIFYADEETDLPAELIEMATSLGVTDMSKLPSLNEAMSLLGTTSADETVSVIRDIASTENGQVLIRQFLQNSEDEISSSEEGDISVKEQQPSVLDVRAEAEAEADEQEPQESVLNEEQRGFFGSQLGAVNRIVASPSLTAPQEEPAAAAAAAVPASSSSSAGGIFSIITNFFRPARPTVSLESLTEPTPVVPALPINQPIPNSPYNIQESDYDQVVRQYYNRPSDQLRDSFTNSFPTLSLPRLPNIYQTPNLIGNFQNMPSVPRLPNIQIPTLKSTAYSQPQTGTYIRVRYPLASFQQSQQQQQQFPRTNNEIISQSTPPRAVVQSSIAAPTMHINHEPMVFELPRPQQHPNQIIRHPAAATTINTNSQSRTPASTYSDISQLPLSVENFNAFRNAPQIVTSYGTPALPFTFDEPVAAAASDNMPVIVRPDESFAANDDTFLEQSSNQSGANNNHQEAAVKADEEIQQQQTAQRRSSTLPQRITAHDVVATGRLGRRANAEAIEAAIPTQKSTVVDNGE